MKKEYRVLKEKANGLNFQGESFWVNKKQELEVHPRNFYGNYLLAMRVFTGFFYFLSSARSSSFTFSGDFPFLIPFLILENSSSIFLPQHIFSSKKN